MGNNIFKYIKILLYVMMSLGLGVFIYWFVISSLNSEPVPYPLSQTVPPGTSVGDFMGVEVMLGYTYVLFALALVITIVFPVVNIITNPKGTIKSLIGLGAMAVLLIAVYALSSAEPMRLSDGMLETNAFNLRVADMGLYATYVMVVGILLLIVSTEIMNSVKK
jgi:hypothetical protein